jgi:hypothetical protein
MTDNANAAAALEAAKSVFAAESMHSLEQGIAHLERAAQFGSGEAMTQLAHFAAAGVTQPANWDQAADMLCEAAHRGSRLAAEELRLLAFGAGGTVKELRARIDFPGWIAQRPSENMRDSPRIRVCRNFLSPAECNWLIVRGEKRLAQGAVYNKAASGLAQDPGRSNSAAPFRLLDMDLPLVLIHSRIGNTLGLSTAWFEPAQLLHYAQGEQFAPHYDFLDPSTPAYAPDLAERGQRIVTVLIYLNDDYQGGETVFPEIGYRFKGKTGDLMCFVNVDLNNGAPDRRTLHTGSAPTRGEKWVLSQWIRSRPAV